LAAGKAVIMNFCSGWCVPCRLADEDLEQIYNDYHSGTCNVNVYGFIMQTNTPGEENTDCSFSQSYAQQGGLTFPVFADISTLSALYMSSYGTNATPTFMVIIPNVSDPGASEVHLIVGVKEDLKQDIEDILIANGYEPNSISVSGDLCIDQSGSVQ